MPGNWISPGGKPQWKRIVAVDDQGQESEVRSSQDVTMAAAELEFPGGKWNLAFRFTPPLKVSLEGTAMRFTVRTHGRDLCHRLLPAGGIGRVAPRGKR